MPRTYWMKQSPTERFEADIARRELLYGKSKELGVSQVELIRRMEQRGLRTTGSELSAVFHGTRHGRKVDAMLDLITDILEEAEHEKS